MKYTFIFKIFLALNWMLFSCAKEPSEESFRRSQQEEQIKRLQFGVGIFRGFAYDINASKIPVLIKTDLRKTQDNPGMEYAGLDTVLNLGEFGGVALSASSTEFDWGLKNLVARFDHVAQGKAGLEIDLDLSDTGGQAKIIGKLKTSRYGDFHLELERSDETSLNLLKDLQDSTFELQLQYSHPDLNLPMNAKMTLERRIKEIKVPSTSDLALLPPLEAFINFSTFALLPQISTGFLYDPILRRIEFKNRDNLSLLIREVDLEEFPWNGDVILNGSKKMGLKVTGYSKLTSSQRNVLDNISKTRLPYKYYSGSYKGQSGGLPLKSFAVIEDLGSVASNPTDYAFDSFPEMSLTVVVCVGNKALASNKYKSFALDYFRRQLILREDRSQATVDVEFSDDWTNIEGMINDTRIPNSSGQSARAQFFYSVTLNNKEVSCDSL